MTDLHPSVMAGGALSPEEITRKLGEGYSIQLVPPGGGRATDPVRADYERIIDETYDAIRLARYRSEQPAQITLWGLPVKIDYAGRLDPGETFRVEGAVDEPRRSRMTPTREDHNADRKEAVRDPLRRP